MNRVEFKEYIGNLDTYLNYKDYTVVVEADKTYCLKGIYSKLNEQYCENNNVEILPTRHFGGTIINFKEDLCIGNFQSVFNEFGVNFMNLLMQYLMNRGLRCEIQDNDLLVDGYKCASYMSTNIEGTIYTAIHISIGMDLELIKNICTKPMKKVPKGLKDFGISTEDIEEFLNTIKEML